MASTPFLLPLDWTPPPGVRAVCTVRTGGASSAPYDSFNTAMHVGDDPSAVATNRAMLRATLGLEAEPVWLEQVHGVTVCDLDAPRPAAALPIADAAITLRSGVACVVQVADCIPVLFASLDGQRVGAAHAGWRGLAAGVLEATIGALQIDPRTLCAWLGPAIGATQFEVGDEVREAFIARDGRADVAFVRNARERWQCDLILLARHRLEAAGITEIAGGRWCTVSQAEQFFSFRRDGRCGRMAALIWRA
jgi:hypothetical protein